MHVGAIRTLPALRRRARTAAVGTLCMHACLHCSSHACKLHDMVLLFKFRFSFFATCAGKQGLC